MKRVSLRQQAERDVRDAIDFYFDEGGEPLANDFLEALRATYESISGQAAAGSPRYGQELGLPGLRSWRLRRFPYLVFYQDREDRVDVWRVMHAQRDIPGHLQEPDT